MQPTPIKLTEFRPAGFAAGYAKPGDMMSTLVRAELTSDQPEFYLMMESLTEVVSSRARAAGVAILMDRVCDMLIVVHDNGEADLYVQGLVMQVEIMAKHELAAGEAVSRGSIGDVRRLRLPGLTLMPSDGIIVCVKVGWKFALFFDLDRSQPIDIGAMERSLGRLYRRLSFQGIYEAFEAQAVHSKMVGDGWFPFIETIGGDFEDLAKAYRADFNVDGERQTLVSRFDAERINGIANRWWRGALLEKRRSILEPALEAFKRGDAVSCLKNVLTEIEGILQEYHISEKGHGVSARELLKFATAKGVQKAMGPDSLLFPLQFLTYMSDYTYAKFDPTKPDQDIMSRHSAGHGGAAASAYTLERALQAILTLDQLNFYVGDGSKTVP
jgi:hypothetical protein